MEIKDNLKLGSQSQKGSLPSVTPVFYEMSRWNRLNIGGALLSRGLTDFAKEDVKDHPWRYPLYIASIGSLAFGFGGLWLVPAIASIPLGVYVKYGSSEWTENVRSVISKAFNQESMKNLYDTHAKSFTHDPLVKGQFRVRKLHLYGSVLKDSWYDMRQSSVYFKKAVKSLFIKEPTPPGSPSPPPPSLGPS